MNVLDLASKALKKGNGFLKTKSAISALSSSTDKFAYLDVGSAGGIPYGYREASRQGFATLLLVDPQEDWRKNREWQQEYQGCDVRYIKTALGKVSETRPFYVTAVPSCSSCLLPNAEVLRPFPVKEWFEIVAEKQAVVRPYSDVHVDLKLPRPDIVKVDVQGMELEVLEGFGSVLDSVTCIELEVNFEQLYIGQPTIAEVYLYMQSHGFVLRDLQPQGPFEGQAIEYNSFWVRQNLSDSQRRICRLWEAIHSIWSGSYLKDLYRRSGKEAWFR